MIGFSPISVSERSEIDAVFYDLQRPGSAAGANNNYRSDREATHVSVVRVFLSSRTCYEGLG